MATRGVDIGGDARLEPVLPLITKFAKRSLPKMPLAKAATQVSCVGEQQEPRSSFRGRICLMPLLCCLPRGEFVDVCFHPVSSFHSRAYRVERFLRGPSAFQRGARD